MNLVELLNFEIRVASLKVWCLMSALYLGMYLICEMCKYSDDIIQL